MLNYTNVFYSVQSDLVHLDYFVLSSNVSLARYLDNWNQNLKL